MAYAMRTICAVPCFLREDGIVSDFGGPGGSAQQQHEAVQFDRVFNNEKLEEQS